MKKEPKSRFVFVFFLANDKLENQGSTAKRKEKLTSQLGARKPEREENLCLTFMMLVRFEGAYFNRAF